MNEQTKSLAMQYAHKMGNSVLHNAEHMEAFAELIVRECARTASMFSIENKRIHPDIDPRNMPEANQVVYHSTCQAVAFEIKEHFGVNAE